MTSAAAKITLSYPLYACDFDPQDANRLIIGGGGGAGRSGVGNKITLLDTSSPSEIQTSAEVELSKEEDNVTSLAAGPRKGNATLVYAGINSSPDDQKKGNNQHCRVFSIGQPSKTKAAAGTGIKIAELARSSLFTTKDTDTYQRVTRLSAPYAGSPQIGAIATGLASQPQIAVFDVSSSAAGGAPKSRGRLDLEKEATDLDLIQTAEEPPQYQLAYCDDYDLYTLKVAKGSTEDPQRIFTIPHDPATGAPRPTFRALRFLTRNFVLAVGNLPKRSGVVLMGYRLATAGDGQDPAAPARLSISAKLPKHVTQATAVAVVNLHPAASPGAATGDTQFVIAVAGVDCSITLYTLEHQSVLSIDVLGKLHPFATLREVHSHPISSLAFSQIQPNLPASASSVVTSSPSKSSKAASTSTTSSSPRGGAPVLKLASTSVANSVVVHTIPLKKHVSPSEQSKSKTQRRGPRQPARYVVAARSRGPSHTGLLVTLTVGVALLAVIMQSFLEIRGLTPTPILGAARVAPASWVRGPPEPLLVRLGSAAHPFVLREGDGSDLKIAPHVVLGETDATEKSATTAGTEAEPLSWDQLPVAQRNAWKERLKAAGHWGEEMGEAIFKGILFGEMGGAVGDFVRG